MVATDVLLLLHEPPAVASLSVIELPAQRAEIPVIDAGGEFKVNLMPGQEADNPLREQVDRHR
jgi:hypothetical protein